MTIDALHAWHVAMRGLLLSPSPVRIAHPTTAVHRRAEMGEQSVSVLSCALLLSPPLPFTACVRSLLLLLLWPFPLAVVVCFEKNTALSRGWCTPSARGSAVCEQNASHDTQILACFSNQLD